MKAKVSTGFDTWVGSAAPKAHHHGGKQLRVATGTMRTLLHLEVPAPPGSVVVSATLRLRAKGASSGARTLTVERLASLWKVATTNWDNAPAVLAGSATASVNALTDGQAVAFDVTAMAQAIVDGSPNYGFRVTTSGVEHRFHSFDAGENGPTLDVVYQERPATPTNLRPAGGRVATATPTLRWDYTGAEDQTAYQVQADTSGAFAPPTNDSGEIAGSKAQHEYGWVLTEGTPMWWRVRVKDAGGQWSFWSDAVLIQRDAKGTVAFQSPSGGLVYDPTPPIIFTLTGETLRGFELFVTPAGDRSQVLHKSGMVESSTGSYTLPKKADKGGRLLVTDGSYEVGVRAYDSKLDRVGSAKTDDEPYVEAWATFSLGEDGGVAIPVIQSVEQDGATPANLITWTCSVADSFIVLRDGEELESGIMPADALVSGTTYQWRDWTATPGAKHTYRVRSMTNGRQSPRSAAWTVPYSGKDVEGLWLIDPVTDRWFVLAGLGLGDWKHLEVGETYLPVGARAGIRITQALGGLAGSFEGLCRERDFRDVPDMEADFWKMKEAAPHSDDFRLVGERLNIPVQAFDLSLRPSEDSYLEYPRRVISFSFFQTGEFQFKGRV